MRWRLLAVLGLGVVVAFSVLGYHVKTAEAYDKTTWNRSYYAQRYAQYVDPSPGKIDAQEAFRLRKFGQASTVPDLTGEANAKVFQTATRAKMAGVANVVKVNLATVAAGIWIHNGIMIYHIADCGQPQCETTTMVLTGKFRQAAIAQAQGGTSGGGFGYGCDSVGCGKIIFEKVVYTGGTSAQYHMYEKWATVNRPSAAASQGFTNTTPNCPFADGFCGSWIGNPRVTDGVILNPVVEYTYAKENKVVASCDEGRVGAPLQEGSRSRRTLSLSDRMAAE